MTLPPASGIKKDVPKLRSNNSSTKPAASTGVESSAKTEVAKIDQQNRGNWSHFMLGTFIFQIVTTKLREPKMEDVPTNTIAKIHMV